MFVTIAYGNKVMATNVSAILSLQLSPMRNSKDGAKVRHVPIVASQGRMKRAVIMTDSDRVIPSAVKGEGPSQRFLGGAEA